MARTDRIGAAFDESRLFGECIMKFIVLLFLVALTSIPFSCAVAPSQAEKEPPSEGVVKELTLDLGGGVTMKLVLIPAGKFMMGSPESEKGRDENEGPQHEVTISKPFYMGVTEVTQAQYEAVMGTNPSHFKGATNPVEMVSWNDATEFCKKLSEKTGQTVRLPTEAEWEYACRAGSKTRFSFGDADEGLGDYAWYNANSGNTTHPVGQKKPNAWGLYDMHGNVWEWCADWFGDYPKGAVTDPRVRRPVQMRVLRGGSWYGDAGECRSGYRSWTTPIDRNDNGGFRVVVSAEVWREVGWGACRGMRRKVPPHVARVAIIRVLNRRTFASVRRVSVKLRFARTLMKILRTPPFRFFVAHLRVRGAGAPPSSCHVWHTLKKVGKAWRGGPARVAGIDDLLNIHRLSGPSAPLPLGPRFEPGCVWDDWRRRVYFPSIPRSSQRPRNTSVDPASPEGD